MRTMRRGAGAARRGCASRAPVLTMALGPAACGGDDDRRRAGGGASGDGEVLVGLITKTDTNPFFVKMREGAEATADELGIELQSFAGEEDGDNQSQVDAVDNLIAAGAAGILITPERLRGDRARARPGPRRRACSSSPSTRRWSRPTRPTPRSRPTTSGPAS